MMIKSGASAKRRRERSGIPGKCGIVRLYGPELSALRDQCWIRDQGICQECKKDTYSSPRFNGDPDAYDMAHIGNKRNHGDVIGNVRCLCHSCHMLEHSQGRYKDAD